MKRTSAYWFVWATMAFLVLFGVSSVFAEEGAIIVGAVQAVKGVFSQCFLDVNDGLSDALTIANEEGGVQGKKIKYVMKETDYDVPESKAKLDQLYKEYHPLVLFGNSTGLSLEIADKICTEYKVLYSSTSFAAELVTGKCPSIFMSGPSYGDQLAILLKYIAKAKHNASVAFFYSDTPFGKDGIKFGEIVAKRLQLRLIDQIAVDLKAKDFTAQVQRLREKNPDYVIFHGFVLSPVPEVIKQCKQLGMTSKYMGLFWTATKEVVDKLGPDADGYLVVNPYSYWGMRDVPMINKIMEFNARHHPEVTYRSNYYMHGFVNGFIYAEVLRRAAKEGALNFDGIVKALESLKGVDTGGLTAPLTIKNNKFPVARIWAADSSTGSFIPAPLPAGLESWITVPD